MTRELQFDAVDGRPHRGGAIRALGLASFLCSLFCVGLILGPIAWFMANNDLNEMRLGRMDRSGEKMTRTGRRLAVIGVLLSLLSFVLCPFVLLQLLIHGLDIR
jgi:hypothetical protein